jgi:hypothetical protein
MIDIQIRCLRAVRLELFPFAAGPGTMRSSERHSTCAEIVMIQLLGSSIICCILALNSAAAGPQEGSADGPIRFEQDRFAIGFWVDPPMDEKADQRYHEIAEANFTLVLGGFGGGNPALVARQLELCEKYGLKALVAVQGFDAAHLPDGPACWGYKVRDEPNAADFPDLRAKVESIRAARPGKLAYINLFPNYANARQLGTATYDEHVGLFCESVDPDVLSMDHYPRFHPEVDSRAAYCSNLGVLRKYSRARDIPFWNFFNTMPYGPHTDPTEAQLRWQIFTSLTYGAKGVLYFCYYTPLSSEFPKGGAIIQRDGRRTRHWYQARRINERLRNLGPTLMQLTSTEVKRISAETDIPKALEGLPITNLERASHDPKFELLAGVFDHADGRRAVMLTNYHFAYSQWPTVVFDVPAADVVEVDQWSGNERPVLDDSPDMEGLQISLDSGEGRLFLLPGN